MGMLASPLTESMNQPRLHRSVNNLLVSLQQLKLPRGIELYVVSNLRHKNFCSLHIQRKDFFLQVIWIYGNYFLLLKFLVFSFVCFLYGMTNIFYRFFWNVGFLDFFLTFFLSKLLWLLLNTINGLKLMSKNFILNE